MLFRDAAYMAQTLNISGAGFETPAPTPGVEGIGETGMADIYVSLAVVLPPALGLLWSIREWRAVARVDLGEHADLQGEDKEGIVEKMRMLAVMIQNGAMSFLYAEYRCLCVFIAVFASVLLVVTGNQQWSGGAVTATSFVVGAVTSMLCGWIAMRIAVFTNVRTTLQCWRSLEAGFDVAIRGGSIMGLSLVSIGVLALYALVQAVQALGPSSAARDTFHCVAGYGLGGSSIALFGRVGGGIYTKAADVGADLAGKNEWGLDEDDYRNPAVIADLVGDNVGDIAGMGADLFGSFAEATCAAMVLISAQDQLSTSTASLMYPLMLSSAGILVGLLSLQLRGLLLQVREEQDVERSLKRLLLIGALLMTPAAAALSWACLPQEFALGTMRHQHVQWWYCALAVVSGLWSGLLIGYTTEYYTSHSFSPVREIAETQKQSAATGIIYGLALGYVSTIVPVLALGTTILLAHLLCGFLGVALSALGMLGTMTLALTIDAYGPISDNAGGIAEMSGAPEVVRKRTDCLDAAGNTTAAVGKGFAIGSAALVSLALFGAFASVAKVDDGEGRGASIMDPWIFMGLLFGAMLPYAFAAWTMKSVGVAANDMVKECMAQFPKIMGDEMASPDYDRCIRISTEASLREMVAPSALVIFSPLAAGFLFGRNTCAGLLLGALVSGVQLAISMSNTGGAWDNAKKYITAGGVGASCGKGSEAHRNAVTGDTVGDPLKDTSGPALNIVMKLTAIISLVFATQIGKFSNVEGGPIWLRV